MESDEAYSKSNWKVYLLSFIGLIGYTVGEYIQKQSPGRMWEVQLLSYGGSLVFCLVLAFASWCKMYYAIGICPNIYHSTLINPVYVDGKIKFKIPKGLPWSLLTGLFSFLGFLSFFYIGFYLDGNKGIGVPALVVLWSPVAAGLLGWLWLEENHTLCDLIGICMIVVGTGLHQLLQPLEGTWVSYLGGFLALVFFIGRYITAKISSFYKFDQHTSGILSAASEGTTGFLLWLVLINLEEISDFTTQEQLFCCLAGFFTGLGTYFLTRALMEGISGVVAAIVIMQTFLVSAIQGNGSFGFWQATSLFIALVGLLTLMGQCFSLCLRFDLNPTIKHHSGLDSPLLED